MRTALTLLLAAVAAAHAARAAARRLSVNVTHFHTEGFVIVEDVFPADEIDALRSAVLAQQAHGLTSLGGWTVPDFLSMPQFEFMHSLVASPRLHEALSAVFDGKDSYRFCGHNDIGVDRLSGWHKDKLNDQYATYQTLPLWPLGDGAAADGHFIVKAALYLQDHARDQNALRVVPRSHVTPSMRTAGSRFLHPRKGSLLIFEQRITHRGQAMQGAAGRVLVSFGFGRPNRCASDSSAHAHRRAPALAPLRHYQTSHRLTEHGRAMCARRSPRT